VFPRAEKPRAWAIGGNAVRAAIALGINMRNDSSRTPDPSKEIRYRVWWSLYSLEHQLSMMTGRPSSIPDDACTTPLPVPMDEDVFHSSQALNLLGGDMQRNARYPGLLFRPPNSGSATSSSERSRSSSKPTSTSRSPSTPQNIDFEWAKNVPPSLSLYFLHHIQLTKISQSVLLQLYTAEAMQTSWSRVQSVIAQLDQRIADWHCNLPGIFDFKRKQRDQNFIQQRMCLGFFYYGTRIIANRPCLCRLDRKIPTQSSRSRDFNRAAAATCIDSAREMLQMLPDEPNAVGLNRIGPWWCILHHLMQATVALLLELAFRSHHMPKETDEIFDAAKKAVRWLHNLGDENYSARRAWNLCNKMLRDAAPKIGREVSHLPEQPPGPLSEPSSSTPRDMVPTTYPPAVSGPTVTQPGLYYGDNFTVPQSELANITTFAGYDEYATSPGGERATGFLPDAAEMEFLSDAYHDSPQHDGYPDHHGGGRW
jgi:Fungal specific transcription factor domain